MKLLRELLVTLPFSELIGVPLTIYSPAVQLMELAPLFRVG